MFVLFLDDEDDSTNINDVHHSNVESNVVGDDEDEDNGNMDFI